MKDKDQPWLGECSYGDEVPMGEGDILYPDENEWAIRQRNQKMIRAGDGYINRQGYASKVKNVPAVVGRNWEFLEKFGE